MMGIRYWMLNIAYQWAKFSDGLIGLITLGFVSRDATSKAARNLIKHRAAHRELQQQTIRDTIDQHGG